MLKQGETVGTIEISEKEYAALVQDNRCRNFGVAKFDNHGVLTIGGIQFVLNNSLTRNVICTAGDALRAVAEFERERPRATISLELPQDHWEKLRYEAKCKSIMMDTQVLPETIIRSLVEKHLDNPNA